MPSANAATAPAGVGPIRIAFATDRRFVHNTAAALHSILVHASRTVEVAILQAELSDDDKRDLERICRDFDATLTFPTVDLDALRHLPLKLPRMSHAAYFRLQLPQLLPPDVHKVLYLDSDIVCRGDIAPLWDTDISAYAVGWVREPCLRFDGKPRNLLRRLLPSREETCGLANAEYFNSGVMLINLDRWRSEAVSSRALAWRARNDHLTDLHDQDALNILLAETSLQLSARWNLCSSHMLLTKFRFAGHRRRLDPALVHFTSDSGLARYARLARRHLAATPWKGRIRWGRQRMSWRQSVGRSCIWNMKLVRAVFLAHRAGPDAEFGRAAPLRIWRMPGHAR